MNYRHWNRAPLRRMPSPLAIYVARKVVKHAREVKNIYENKMWCPDCKLLPTEPVTGRCGHTRCSMCIKNNGACPCGAHEPENLRSNILVRDLIEKLLSNFAPPRVGVFSTNVAMNGSTSAISTERCAVPAFSGRTRNVYSRQTPRNQSMEHTGSKFISPRLMVAYPQKRYKYVQKLLSLGRHREAAAHLAHIAASSEPFAQRARYQLAQVIAVLSSNRDPRSLTSALCRSVRQQSLLKFVDHSSMECPVCYDVMEQPVTTLCGHTFCRECLTRIMQTRTVCPLCSSSLSDQYIAQTENTEFICAILGTIATTPQIDPDLMPIFVCTVAFPDIPCPLMFFDTDFRKVVRGVLDAGSRRFGMITSLGDDTYSDYGTIVEVRDCVVFEDGRSILSTIGISRFRVIEKVIINGCPYARVEELTDITPVGNATILELQLLAEQIRSKTQQWLPTLDIALQTDVATCFGDFPEMNLEGEWWDNPNGPIWLWWLIAMLPLRTEIQMLMLSTKHLTKRMMAVLRTLDAMEHYSYVYRIV